jgi:hypothetical protein
MVCVAVTMACSGALAGYVNYNISPDTSAFAYRDGNATTFQAFGNAVFGPSSRYETVVVTSPTGLNVLDKRVLQALFQVDAAVRNLTITAPVTDSGASAGEWSVLAMAAGNCGHGLNPDLMRQVCCPSSISSGRFACAAQCSQVPTLRLAAR